MRKIKNPKKKKKKCLRSQVEHGAHDPSVLLKTQWQVGNMPVAGGYYFPFFFSLTILMELWRHPFKSKNTIILYWQMSFSPFFFHFFFYLSSFFVIFVPFYLLFLGRQYQISENFPLKKTGFQFIIMVSFRNSKQFHDYIELAWTILLQIQTREFTKKKKIKTKGKKMKRLFFFF